MSDQMSDPADRKLVVVLGDTELTAEVRAALASLPWPVRYVEDPAALAERTDPGDLVLRSLGSSPFAEDATEPSRGSVRTGSPR